MTWSLMPMSPIPTCSAITSLQKKHRVSPGNPIIIQAVLATLDKHNKVYFGLFLFRMEGDPLIFCNACGTQNAVGFLSPQSSQWLLLHTIKSVKIPAWAGHSQVPPLDEELPATEGCWDSFLQGCGPGMLSTPRRPFTPCIYRHH